MPSADRIPDGATVERAVEGGFGAGPTLTLNLKRADFTDAERVAAAVDRALGPGHAHAVDPVSIEVLAPPDAAGRTALMARLEAVEIAPDTPAARVIVNARTGTIVIGGAVRVSPAAVAHGNLIVRISEDLNVSQPAPLSGGRTVVTPKSTVAVEQEPSRMFLFAPGVALSDLVDAVTTEKQRKGIADYFAPTLVKMAPKSSGSNGLLAGHSMRDSAGRAPSTSSGGKGMIASIVPREVGTGMQKPSADRTPEEARREVSQQQDRAEFIKVKAAIDAGLAADKSLTDLRRQIRYTETREGLRIEIIDRAGFSMFALRTDRLVPRAARLMASVATGVIVVPNPVALRGHTDALGYAGPAMNNWKLSTARAEATREAFEAAGIPETRFARIEGVAAREPFYPAVPTDPRNRRITVTLFYREPGIAG